MGGHLHVAGDDDEGSGAGSVRLSLTKPAAGLAAFAENVALDREVQVMLVTDAQKTIVQNTFAKVAAIDDAAVLFYQRLFELDPSLRPLFRGAIAEQRRQLILTLGTVVRGLDRFDHLVPLLRSLGRRHAGYAVVNTHYDTFADALLWTLERTLGSDFTSEVKAAWTAVYTQLAMTMKDAAREVLVAV